MFSHLCSLSSFLLIYKDISYILDMNPLWFTWIINTLLHSVAYFFMLLITSFNEQKFQTKIKGTFSFLVISLSSLLYTLVCTDTEENFKNSPFYHMKLNWELNLTTVKNNSLLPYGLNSYIPSFNVFSSFDSLCVRNHHQWQP